MEPSATKEPVVADVQPPSSSAEPTPMVLDGNGDTQTSTCEGDATFDTSGHAGWKLDVFAIGYQHHSIWNCHQ